MMMNRLLPLLLVCAMCSPAAFAQTFSDDFESYTPGIPLGPQSADWRTWTGAGGGADDADVSTMDNHTAGGYQSIFFQSSSAWGGPQNVVLPVSAGAPLSTGQFSFKTWFKVPAAKSAYFNLQGAAALGVVHALDCWLHPDGTLEARDGVALVASGSYPPDAWFEMQVEADLNANLWELKLNGVSLGTWNSTTNEVWGINYFPDNSTARFWIDDVQYQVVPYTLPALNGGVNLVEVAPGLAGSARPATVQVRNLGSGTISSFDLALSHNGGTPVTQSVTGLSLASLASTTVAFSAPFTLTGGANTFQAVISNVNGMGADGDSDDDTLVMVMEAVTPALGKRVVAEERTGTWCGWCPRGIVYMQLAEERYGEALAPIAVHNGDPMEVPVYDDGIAPLIAALPGMVVDRDPVIEPEALEAAFLGHVVLPPAAFVSNGALWDPVSRELKVSVTCTNQMAIPSDLKLACVLTEDSVTGTIVTYAQHNFYAGGGFGPMGGFELLADPVPAADMVYDHVARFISPGFGGIPFAPGASTASGDVWTHNFTFTLPSTVDENHVHIIGMVIRPSGEIENAGSATVAEAVASGYVDASTAIGGEQLQGPDAVVRVYPNPSAGASQIALHLGSPVEVSVSVVNPQGQQMGSRAYGELGGSQVLPLDLTGLAAGIYMVHVTAGDQTFTRKVVRH